MIETLRPLSKDILISEKEAEIFLRLLPLLRREPPRNGAPDIIVITRTEHYCSVADTNKRGKIDLHR